MKNHRSSSLLWAALVGMLTCALDVAAVGAGSQGIGLNVQLAFAQTLSKDLDSDAATRAAATEPSSPDLQKHSITVARGDTLYAIARAHGFRKADLPRILSAGQDTKRLARLKPGQVLEFYVDDGKSIVKLIHQINPSESLHVERTKNGYRSERVEEQLDRQIATVTGTIDNFFIPAARNAGLSHNVIRRMTEILGWDVDFALDIRPGDRFTVIYEELFKNGEKVDDGDIVAAEFINRGRVIRALRYTDSAGWTGYYAPDGQNMRKAFLRTPVKYSRISSRFDLRRKHPVLHKVRAHRGVDYAARTGTPIESTGDGTVIFKGRKGGYGRTVVIKHGNKYTTLYAHMSKYARGIKRGARVRQGQTIGYVGKSGLATGPHLHYEFRVDGRHRDPLRIRPQRAASIPAVYQVDFQEKAAGILAELDLLSNTQLALNDS